MTMTGQPGKPVYCKTIEDYILDTNKKMDSIDSSQVVVRDKTGRG